MSRTLGLLSKTMENNSSDIASEERNWGHKTGTSMVGLGLQKELLIPCLQKIPEKTEMSPILKQIRKKVYISETIVYTITRNTFQGIIQ